MNNLTNVTADINKGKLTASKASYKSMIITRPDGSTYMQCVWTGSEDWTFTSEHELTADQLKEWNTTN